MDINSYDNKPINSPFRWAGGKFYARKLISRFIPNHDFYVEPFFGGGSVFFYKNKTNSWINDLDKELINCYRVIQNEVDDLIEFLDGEVATKERHHYYKNTFIPSNDLERAARYYYINRTSYSGIMKKQNCYFGYGEKYSMRPENWGRQLIKNNLKLQDVKISSIDFEEMIKSSVNRNAFLFIDPPYFNADQDKFYEESFKYEDHIRLANLLKEFESEFKFLLTYDNCQEIRDLYSWTSHINPQEWNYTINRTDDQKQKIKLKDGHSGTRKKGKEIFITNYDATKLDIIV